MKNKKAFLTIVILLVISFAYLYFKNNQNSDLYKTLLAESASLKQSKLIECPPGTVEFLKSGKIQPEQELQCELQNIPLVVNGDSVVAIQVIYGGYHPVEDVQLGKSEPVFMLPSGKLVTDNGLFVLPAKFSYYGGAEVGKLYGTPFPDDSRLWGTRRGDRYVALQGKIEGPNSNGEYCGKYVAILPATGEITVCGTSDKNASKVTGSVGFGNGVPIYLDSVANGKLVADAEYLKMGVDKKFLNTEGSNPAYRTDMNAWIISYFLIKNVESAKIKTPVYNTFIAIKVGADGNACIVNTYLSGQKRPDFTKGEYPCLK